MSFFTQAAPKVRQEGFNPPSPPFDSANMFFAHHIFPNDTHHYKQQPNAVDFGDELAAMMAHQDTRPTPPPHNPFDTNSTAPYRPHNIFDVSSPPATTHHPAHFPAHFSLPAHHRVDFETAPAPSTAFAPDASSSFRDPAFPDRRASSRSRSRSKPPAPRAPAKKRASISSRSPTRPQAILIPPTQHGHTHHPASPLSLHMHAQTAPSAWFAAADAPFSLPTPDSVGPGAFLGTSPKSVSAKDSPPPPHDAASKQAQLASEKRRRRRESHNAVERRRRDNINEKISELATLIPECMLDPSAGSNSGDASLEGFAGVPHPSEDGDDRKDAAGAVKANKGMILRKSVEYIRYLQQLVNAQATRNRELEAQLSHPHSQPSASASPPPHAHPGLVLQEDAMDDEGMITMNMNMNGGAGLESPREDEETEDVDLDDEEGEERGRATRGRPLGVRVKREEGGEGASGDEGEKDMEE